MLISWTFFLIALRDKVPTVISCSNVSVCFLFKCFLNDNHVTDINITLKIFNYFGWLVFKSIISVLLRGLDLRISQSFDDSTRLLFSFLIFLQQLRLCSQQLKFYLINKRNVLTNTIIITKLVTTRVIVTCNHIFARLNFICSLAVSRFIYFAIC